uniref:ATP synthase CF0, subunit B n=1 Tax=Dictyotopsis propagulifera TaxID=670095 RepID=UPI002E7980CA|nr:ATP synthase CF0, subunit B [Dictyotopsis propagulifera]WAM63228.1 ATP synthase CF0, subunit B [Dictyotopsis propagulifera]
MQYFFLICNESIELNLDIFETNIINLGVLLIGLIIIVKNFFKELLGARKTKIVLDIENAETSLNNSNKRYREARKELSQIDIVIKGIIDQMVLTKKTLVKDKVPQIKNELSNRFKIAIGIIRSREEKLFIQVIREIYQKALGRVILKLKKQLGTSEQSSIIEKSIFELEKL